MVTGEILAFSREQVSRLANVSEQRLRYWDNIGLLSPKYADENRRRPFSRVYSFRDLVGLRTLVLLRDQYHVSLQELRRFDLWLRKNYETPWSSLTFSVSGKKLFFDDPETGALVASRPQGQVGMRIVLETIANETSTAIARLRKREDEQIGKIVRHRNISHNAPVLAGTRIPTESVWGFHCAGYDTDRIIRQFPILTPADVQAAIEYEEERQSQKRAS
jgi:DNA-binding transcriptional MerR regulator